MRTLLHSSRILALGLGLYAATANGQASLPAARWGQATTVIGSTILVHGGKLDQNNSFSYSSAPNTAQLLSLDLSSGFTLDNPPWGDVDAPNGPALAFHSITAFSQQELLFFGGDPGPELPLSTRNDSAGTLWYAGHRGTWKTYPDGWAQQPMRRQYHSANSFHGRVFITGGEKVDGSDFGFRDPYVFNPWVSGSQFSALSSDASPPDLVGHSTITLPNGTLFVLGGYSRSTQQLQPLNTVYTYNIWDGSWSSFNTNGDVVPTGRRNFAAVLVGTDSVLIHGGADGSFLQGRSDGFLLSFSSRTWTSLPALDQALGARWDHAAFGIGNSVFFAYGYTSNGPASNALLLYDVPSGSFQGSYTPPGGLPNTNSPAIYPDNGGGGGGGGNSPPSGSGSGDSSPGGQDTTGNPGGSTSPPHNGQSGNDSKGNSTPIVLGSIFGGLAAAALVVVIIVVYRRRRNDRNNRRGWSGTSDDAEKLVVVGGFQRVPRGKGYGLVTRLLNVRPTTVYTQAPARERFDILGDEANSHYRRESRPRGYRTGTGDTGSSYGAGNLRRWGSLGNAPSAIGSLVTASVSSFKTTFGLNNPPPAPVQDLKGDSNNGGSRNLMAPPSAWRRGSSYTSNYHTDPFGDENGVEEEYQRAMGMQHEALKRASSSGTDEYSALILNRNPSEGVAQPIPDTSRHSNLAFIPLAPVVSGSTDPSQSHGSDEHHERQKTSATTHGTTIITPFADGSQRSGSPRVHSPTPYQLQRATSAGSRIGASLTRAISAVSTLFSGGHEYQSPRQRGKSLGGGVTATPYQYDYEDLRDPNPPPPMLGMGLLPIAESRGEDASRHASRFMSSSEGGVGTTSTGRPPLVLRALHGKSLSSLRTANSEALERLGTGNWNVIQRDETGSTRRTDGSLSSVPDSQYTDLVGENAMGDADSASMKWQDVVGQGGETRTVVESPVDLASRDTFFNDHPPLASLSGPSSPAGPRPIPPSKHVSYSLAQRMETLGRGADNAPSSPTARHHEPTSPRRPTYVLAPKPTLFIANPGRRGATDSS
ncbi:SubName: Full=Uncharacterized protein {ECO:0000313/EMBL:CCA67065.1} [Serendipita indica DSM 11827]|nr:SubName: Full=Uncharacterized protein {ECO:0000313/EMBL:CCA67065.1} [Serendipita indica DSM 11827]